MIFRLFRDGEEVSFCNVDTPEDALETLVDPYDTASPEFMEPTADGFKGTSQGVLWEIKRDGKEEIMDDPAVFTVSKWETPATKYPLNKVGRAKITRSNIRKAVYRMEGVKGYDYYEVKKPIPITSLKIGRETVMVDDPLQWIGMQEIAKHCKGNVITAGLGLGLVTHALANNHAVKSITVVEREADVIELVKPLVLDAVRSRNGSSPEIEIIKGDIFENITLGYDILILDIWWGRSNAKTYFEMLEAYSAARAAYPGMKVYIWGLKDPEMNPAIPKEEKKK